VTNFQRGAAQHGALAAAGVTPIAAAALVKLPVRAEWVSTFKSREIFAFVSFLL